MRSRVILMMAVALLATGVACGKNKPSGGPVTDFVTGVSTIGGTSVQASQHSGSAPQPASGGPTATATGNANVVNGGSNAYGIGGSQAYQKVFVSVTDVPGSSRLTSLSVAQPMADSTTRTADGFWQLDLPAAVSQTSIIVNFGKAIPATTFTLQFQVANANGTVGTIATIPATVLTAGTGDVQVTASWDTASDVDLHVVEPNGNEVFWAAPTSTTGGALDLDSNPGCAIDNKNNENIRWPTGRAPAGTYIVRLDYFSACNQALTNFVVTVNNGGSTNTFTGSFTPQNADAGANGAGRLITTFTRGSTLLAPLSDMFFGDSRASSPPSATKLEMVRRRVAGGS